MFTYAKHEWIRIKIQTRASYLEGSTRYMMVPEQRVHGCICGGVQVGENCRGENKPRGVQSVRRTRNHMGAPCGDLLN